MSRFSSPILLASFLAVAGVVSGQDEFLDQLKRDAAAARQPLPTDVALIPDRAREMETFKTGQIVEGPFDLTEITESKIENLILWLAFARRKGDTRQFVYCCTKEPQKTMPFASIFPDIGTSPESFAQTLVGRPVPGAVLIFDPDMKKPFPDQ